MVLFWMDLNVLVHVESLKTGSDEIRHVTK